MAGQQHEELRIADGMFVRWVDVAALREQDVNAQVMQPQQFARLTANIKDRGMLESLPYCYQPGGEGVVEIVSGHHRARAARAAGLKQIPVIVDTRPMTSSQKASKQIAHNELHGSPDEALLRQLAALITDVDDMLASGLGEDYLPTVEPDKTSMDVPSAAFDWRTVTLTFLPKQMDTLTDVIDTIGSVDLAGVAPVTLFEDFAKACYRYGRIKEVKAIGTTIALLTEIAQREIQAHRDAENQTPDTP